MVSNEEYVTAHKINRLKDMDNGDYLIKKYSIHHGYMGRYLIEALSMEDNEIYCFWSNSYFANYLSTKHPKRAFYVNIHNSKIIVIGQYREVILI